MGTDEPEGDEPSTKLKNNNKIKTLISQNFFPLLTGNYKQFSA